MLFGHSFLSSCPGFVLKSSTNEAIIHSFRAKLNETIGPVTEQYSDEKISSLTNILKTSDEGHRKKEEDTEVKGELQVHAFSFFPINI